ncbi:MAG: tyrosine-type recombinase/integrase [Hahellaceae bacterium]|nr:tyrosine-type recombinase/integrase [Hahellaceae bacterium]
MSSYLRTVRTFRLGAKNWWLKVFGKGRKLRDISVPDSFLSYLERYRLWRGLSARPGMQEKEPIVEKIRGAGGMTARQLARLVEQVLLRAYDDMLLWQGKQAAQIFRDVSPHWLRHTGASMEIDRGRALKDVSEDLGHASMATTDTVYVRSAAKKPGQKWQTAGGLIQSTHLNAFVAFIIIK